MLTINRERKGRNRGVSPVIGVILMVAITVILAAVIGTLVLDIGQENANAAPQASFKVSVDTSVDSVSINHVGGDQLHATQTRIVIANDSGTTVTFDPVADGPVLRVGDTAEFQANGTNQDTLDWNGDGSVDYTATDQFTDISEGDELTITMVDVETQREIFETQILA